MRVPSQAPAETRVQQRVCAEGNLAGASGAQDRSILHLQQSSVSLPAAPNTFEPRVLSVSAPPTTGGSNSIRADSTAAAARPGAPPPAKVTGRRPAPNQIHQFPDGTWQQQSTLLFPVWQLHSFVRWLLCCLTVDGCVKPGQYLRLWQAALRKHRLQKGTP